MTISEMISVLLAYKSGKTIEAKSIDYDDKWVKTLDPTFNFAQYEYRIAPRKTYYRVGVCKLPNDVYTVFAVSSNVPNNKPLTLDYEKVPDFAYWATDWTELNDK